MFSRASVYLIAVLCLTLILVSSAPGEVTGAPDGPAWLTIANGDDVRHIVRLNGVLWTGTQAGGAVRWDAAGHYRQYLYPQDGLASNDVRDIVAHAGRIWFATSRGLSALGEDGRWTMYTTANTQGGLPSDDVTALASAPDGSLWVGTVQRWTGRDWVGGGVARFRNGQWQTFTPADQLASLNITDLAVTPSGQVWAVGRPYLVWVPPADPAPGFFQANGGGASVFSDEYWTRYQRNDGAPAALPNSNVFYAAWADSNDRVWFGAATGLLMYDPAGWSFWTVTGGGAAANHVTAVSGSGDGRLWLAVTDPSGVGLALSILDTHGTPNNSLDDTWQHIPTANLPASTIQAILPDATGVWLGLQETTGNGYGLVRLNSQGQVAEQRQTFGLRSNFISALAVAPDNTLWIGTGATETLGRGKGLQTLAPDGSWTHTRSESRSATAGTTLTRAANINDAIVYVNWTSATVAETALAAGSFMLGDDPTRYTFNGFIPFGNEGLILFTPGLTRALPVGTPLYPIEMTTGSDDIASIAFGADGSAWVATRGERFLTEGGYANGGLSRFHKDRNPAWQLYRKTSTGLPTNNLSAVAVGPDGRVWAGTGGLRDSTGNGLAVLNPTTSQWTRYTVSHGLPSDLITGIVAAPEGDVWISAAPYWLNGVRFGGGVGLLRNGEWTAWTPTNSRLVADYADVRALGRDRRGGIWAGGWRYEGPSLLTDWPSVQAIANRYAGGEWASWSFPKDGWVTSIAVDPDNRLWVGTSRGGYEPDLSAGGLWVYDRSTWTRLDTNAGLADNDIQAVTVDADGTIWIGTIDHGLSRYNPAGASIPTPVPPTLTATRVPASTVTPTITTSPTTTASPTTTTTPTITTSPTMTATPTITRTPTITLTPYPTVTPGLQVYRGFLPLVIQNSVVIDPLATPTPKTPLPTITRPPGSATPSPTATATRVATSVPPGVWTAQTVGNAHLRAIGFMTSDEGWAVGDGGVMLRYKPGPPPTWSQIASPTRANLRAIAAMRQGGGVRAWAVGDGGTVLAYRDGAWRAWTDDPLPAKDWRAIASTGDVAWMVSSDSTFAQFVDGHWRLDLLAPGNVFGLRALALTVDGRRGVAVGDQGRLALYHGDTNPPYWDSSVVGLGSDLYTVAFVNNNAGWMGGDFPALLHYPSLDCGSRPSPCWGLALNAPHNGSSIRGMAFADERNGWAVGPAGRLFHWNGQAWQSFENSPTITNLNGLTLLSAQVGWAVGDNGVILRYTAS